MTLILRKFLLATCAALVGVAGNAYPQTMYRCGKSLQDRPCDISQPGQAIGRTTAPADTATQVGSGATTAARSGTAGGDAQCAQRGVEAQKIKWEREAGMTEQAQLSLPKSNAQRQLISDVYQRQGSAPQIRAAIEADCIKDNERRAQAAAMIEAASKLLPQNSPPSSAAPVTAASNADVAKQKIAVDDTSRIARCADLQRSADSVRERQRTGGSISTMEALSREQQKVDKSRSDAGC